jgi:xanthine dehydrogenase iron-sulfur cluster and FAD-binding subunit A
VFADGAELVTVEGLADGDNLHPVQEAFIEAGAFQCGFCTPGFVLMTTQLLAAHPDPSDDQIRHYLSGNLCRCGAYPQILDAVKLAARKLRIRLRLSSCRRAEVGRTRATVASSWRIFDLRLARARKAAKAASGFARLRSERRAARIANAASALIPGHAAAETSKLLGRLADRRSCADDCCRIGNDAGSRAAD